MPCHRLCLHIAQDMQPVCGTAYHNTTLHKMDNASLSHSPLVRSDLRPMCTHYNITHHNNEAHRPSDTSQQGRCTHTTRPTRTHPHKYLCPPMQHPRMGPPVPNSRHPGYPLHDHASGVAGMTQPLKPCPALRTASCLALRAASCCSALRATSCCSALRSMSCCTGAGGAGGAAWGQAGRAENIQG